MKKIVKSVLALMLIIGLSGCSDKAKESPVKVNLKQAYNAAWKFYYPKVFVTSKVDTIKVTNVIVNKGNCVPSIAGETNRTLGYGEQMEVRFKKNCKVMKVEVVTDQGNWTVEY
ncbi:MAG: hypothetical protein DRG78_12945 [Epsilonproteobacteria bacterium]|nr:MAG: hypothetical protein DRG78_12945 [Campylobacterota bacterium]